VSGAATAVVAFALALASGSDDAGAPPAGAIRFTGRNAVFTADGQFRSWRVASATVDEEHPERSRIEVAIDLASLDTGNAERDAHLRSADFFDVARYPEARAVVERFRAEPGDRFTADVTLDMHGAVRTFPMTFAITDRARRRVEGRVTVDRTAFGIGAPKSRWNPLSVDDSVEVRVVATVPDPDRSGSPAD